MDDSSKRVDSGESLKGLEEGTPRLLLALRAANVGLWDWDLRTNEVYFSPEWKRQIGCEVDEIPNAFEEWRRRVHPDDLPRVMRELEEFLRKPTREYQAEFRFQHRDGSYRWILAQGSLILENGKPARFLGSHVDLTQRRLADETQRESEAWQRLTLANISDTVLLADDEGRIKYVCPDAPDIFGYSPAEVMALGRMERLVGPGFLDPVELQLKGELRNLERRICDRSGRKRTLLVNAKRVAIKGGTILYTCRDITEREETQEVFRSLAKGTAAVGEAFFKSLVRELAAALRVRYAFVAEAVPDHSRALRTVAVWARDGLAANFDYALPGTPCENVMERGFCFYPDDVQALFPQDTLLARMGAVAYMGTPLFGSDGKLLGLAVVVHDGPISSSERAKSVLTVFAARAGAELERLRAERALRHNEELFRAIVEDQAEMIVRWKPDGTCTFVNQAYCSAVQKLAKELVGSPCVPSVARERGEAIHARAGSLSPERPVATHIYESTSLVGNVISEEWTDRGIFDEQGHLVEIQSTGRDITERRRAEIRIRQLNRVYAVLSSVNETIVREGDPARLFQAACRIAVEKGSFMMAWIGMLDPETQKLNLVAAAGASAETLDTVKRLYQDPRGGCAFTERALRTGIHAVCNNIALDPEAAPWKESALKRGYRAMASFPIKVEGVLVGTFNIYAGEAGFFDEQEVRLLDELAMDIGFALQVHQSELVRQRAEVALEESEARFRQLTEAIQDVFWMVDLASDRLLYVSPAYDAIWGRSRRELSEASRLWMDSIHADDRERVMAYVNEHWQSARFEVEYRIVRPDGEVRWIRDGAFPITDPAGNVLRIAGVARDVTEQRSLQEQLRQSQKMEAIGQLAGGVAHDFNNILAAIILQTEMAAMFPNTPMEVQRDLREVRAAAERAANLTRQLLLFSRRQLLQSQDVNLNDAVAEVVRLLERIIGSDIRLQLNLHPNPLVTRADPGMLGQVILNLAVNARDAMPNGGRLLIETAAGAVDDDFARLHPEAVPGRYVWVSVSDTGAGIPPDVLPRIFEPFFTTKAPGKGTGLGLATVYGIVKQHRGWLHVHSEVGHGTTIQVFLPADRAPDAEEPKPATETPPGGGTETILLAEDDPSVRMLVRAILERHGYTVHEAASGDEAAALWQTQGRGVALLLTDLVMPGKLNGMQLADRLRADKPDLKVIFVSGYSSDLAGRELDLRKGENFLQKPFGPSQLLTTVRESLDIE